MSGIIVDGDWGHGWRPTGDAVYTHLIRSKDDYPETPRERRKARPMTWRKMFAPATEGEWRDRILGLLQDGKERTYNGIIAELTEGEMTAERTLHMAPDNALWALAQEGAIEHTLEAPIRWRTRS